ncbi:MAG: A/G-specific adenine glycosylase [Bacteroidota bacterium]
MVKADFSQKILEWYHEHQRDLPWRSTKDPYRIWLSEIILQQTRVVQGTPYYHKFVKAFPTVHDLAQASEEKVLKLWQGLGYYSRARNLHATAKMVSEEFKGEFPDSYEGLKQLKGVGDYTASAIASISFDLPEPVVDGNVYRVLARYFGVDLPINSPEGVKYFKTLAREVMDTENIRDYNQGIMEFGAIQCAPKKPYCLVCPIQTNCAALNTNQTSVLPKKLNKTKVKHRFFDYLVLLDSEKNTVLEQRIQKGIWHKLYQFPLIEGKKVETQDTIRKQIQSLDTLPKIRKIGLYNETPVIHKLSHQHLNTRFWIVETEERLDQGIPWETVEDYPVPVLISDFLTAFKI